MKKKSPYGWIAVALVLLTVCVGAVVVGRERTQAKRLNDETRMQNLVTDFQREANSVGR